MRISTGVFVCAAITSLAVAAQAGDGYGDPIALEAAAQGVTLLATPGVWPPGAPDLPKNVIPVLVTVRNESGEAIEVDLSDFSLRGRQGRQHPPIWPETLLGDAGDLGAPAPIQFATDATDEANLIWITAAERGGLLAGDKRKTKTVRGKTKTKSKSKSRRVISTPKVRRRPVAPSSSQPRIKVKQRKARPRYTPAKPQRGVRVDSRGRSGHHDTRPPRGWGDRRGGRGHRSGHHQGHGNHHWRYHPYWSVHIGVPLAWWGCHPWWGCFHRRHHVVQEYAYYTEGGEAPDDEAVPDILQLALKEGVLEPDRKVSGFLFFESRTLRRGATLQWEVWADEGDQPLTLLALELPRD